MCLQTTTLHLFSFTWMGLYLNNLECRPYPVCLITRLKAPLAATMPSFFVLCYSLSCRLSPLSCIALTIVLLKCCAFCPYLSVLRVSVKSLSCISLPCRVEVYLPCHPECHPLRLCYPETSFVGRLLAFSRVLFFPPFVFTLLYIVPFTVII